MQYIYDIHVMVYQGDIIIIIYRITHTSICLQNNNCKVCILYFKFASTIYHNELSVAEQQF